MTSNGFWGTDSVCWEMLGTTLEVPELADSRTPRHISQAQANDEDDVVKIAPAVDLSAPP
ncbi:hypothetical protein TRIATDRAFT_316788 [Trichoderma atroviride IMI 206040]|uniref:Uncharacterized protein n=1 Tax=Hypocrea atroviridis (strain ATCC 20476 / IMI 206040) TaxID=452589 RepID=G9NNZ7_HYPAI|nr:uncharacterized protein TRIATDRAFT_316788 [Trichoderma atroviride IMI 206040]EHK47784.1 hypothetical protein TRIATDRAFT_316788 [Trichoderma atroviride IMI 206040]